MCASYVLYYELLDSGGILTKFNARIKTNDGKRLGIDYFVWISEVLRDSGGQNVFYAKIAIARLEICR